MKTGKKWMVGAAVSALALGVTIFLSCNHIFSKNLSLETKNRMVDSVDGAADVLKLQAVLRQIAKSISPAVVSVNVESEVTVQNPYGPFMDDPFFRRFFGDDDMNQKEYKRKMQSMGSGFIITKDGYLFSNYHVVKDATKIKVVLADNKEYDAKVIGVDAETDIALLKINADNLPFVPLGDSSELEVGDFVVAIGSPFSLKGTFTFGVVSALQRPGMMSGFQKFIQTDAAVNPGNSGGPLINIKGQVVGINSAIVTRSGGSEGISFAIPINLAKSVATQLIETGKVERGYIGVIISEVDSASRKVLGLDNIEGVMVSKVEKNGPAFNAGIKQGDIITRVNNEKVGSPDELQAAVGGLAPGTDVRLQVLRDNKRFDVTLKVVQRPKTLRGDEASNDQDNGVVGDKFEFLGGMFAAASSQVLDKNGAEFGVVLQDIKQGSPLEGVLERGVIVAAINNAPIKSLTDLKKFSDDNKDKKSFTFLTIKDGMMYYRGLER